MSFYQVTVFKRYICIQIFFFLVMALEGEKKILVLMKSNLSVFLMDHASNNTSKKSLSNPR